MRFLVFGFGVLALLRDLVRQRVGRGTEHPLGHVLDAPRNHAQSDAREDVCVVALHRHRTPPPQPTARGNANQGSRACTARESRGKVGRASLQVCRARHGCREDLARDVGLALDGDRAEGRAAGEEHGAVAPPERLLRRALCLRAPRVTRMRERQRSAAGGCGASAIKDGPSRVAGSGAGKEKAAEREKARRKHELRRACDRGRALAT
eukprot:3848827-Rhodomonas_salina.1